MRILMDNKSGVKSMSVDKSITRQELKALTAKFFEKGGKVTQCPSYQAAQPAGTPVGGLRSKSPGEYVSLGFHRGVRRAGPHD